MTTHKTGRTAQWGDPERAAATWRQIVAASAPEPVRDAARRVLDSEWNAFGPSWRDVQTLARYALGEPTE